MLQAGKKRTSSNDEDDGLSSTDTLLSVQLTSTPTSNNNDNATTTTTTTTTYFCGSHASFLYALIFFLSMIFMELILEGTQNAFTELLALPYAVTFFQFMSCFLLPVAISKGNSLQHLPKSVYEIVPFIVLSLVAFGSNCFKSMSVRYVSFPTKVIFKSTKLIPTMMISSVLQQHGRQKYTQRDYLAASLLCAGAAGYSFGETKTNDDKQDSYFGLILLAISVFCDCFTPNLQQRYMAPPTPSLPPAPLSPATTTASISRNESVHSLASLIQGMPSGGGGLGLSASTLMTNTNAVGCVGVFAFMTLSGHLHDAIGEALVRPHLFGNLVLIGFSLATAVYAHIRLIKESGAVVAVAVATLREVATVVLSYVVYPKAFSIMHAISALLVLGGILLSMSFSTTTTTTANTHPTNTRSTLELGINTSNSNR